MGTTSVPCRRTGLRTPERLRPRRYILHTLNDSHKPLSGRIDRNAEAEKDEATNNAAAIPPTAPAPRAAGGLRRYRGRIGHRRRRDPGRPGT